jgi:hypothetical protein
MNTIYRDGKVKIAVYADHHPPHFHVITPDGESVIDLATMTETESGANKKLLSKAMAWALENRSVIEAEWNRLNRR